MTSKSSDDDIADDCNSRCTQEVTSVVPILSLQGAGGIDNIASSSHSWHDLFRNVNFDLFRLPQIREDQLSTVPRITLPSHSSMYKMRQRSRIRNFNNDFQNIMAAFKGEKLRTAASTCNTEQLTRILDSGVNPNMTDEYKRSPLHLSACRGYIRIVQQLLKYGANPNVIDSLGNTPLHLAVISASSNNFNVVVRNLLQAGASVHIRDRCGKTPLELAESKLRIMRSRHCISTDESEKILESMCLLTSLLLRYLVQQDQEIADLSALEKQLQNLSTNDKTPQDTVLTETADALIRSVERLSLEK